MPNDVPDWTSQVKANLYGTLSGIAQGDVSAATLSPDSALEYVGNATVSGVTAVLASFKALTAYLLVAAGAPLIGSSTGVNPLYAQNTTAGNTGIACVTGSASGLEPTTSAPGWVKAISASTSGGWAAIWVRPNLGGAEAPPQFTGGGAGLSVMAAQVSEYSGGVTSNAVDQTASAGGHSSPIAVTNAVTDVAFGDLVVLCTHYSMAGTGVNANFLEVFNNGAAAVQDGSVNSDFNSIGRNSVFSHAIVPAAGTAQPLGVAEWVYDATGNSDPAGAGTQASVVLAASPGKRYIAAFLSASATSVDASAGTTDIQLLDAFTTIHARPVGETGGNGNTAGWDAVGLAFSGTKGNSMTWRFSTALTGIFMRVTIGAYLR